MFCDNVQVQSDDCTAETMHGQAKIIHHVTHGHTFKVSAIYLESEFFMS